MPADLFRRIDLDGLYPPFRAIILEVTAKARALGAEYVATYGLRSYEEQAELFRLWRDGKGGRAAPPGRSAHNYGLAVDFVRDADAQRPGVQPDWREPAYAVLGECAQSLGLVWGGGFADAPHVQWPGFVRGRELAQLRIIGTQSDGTFSLRPVWDSLEEERATPDWQRANPALHDWLMRLGFEPVPAARRA